MRCLYCGKRLPLLRKLTDPEFCTAAHRRRYQQEQEKMALARLTDGQEKYSSITGLNTQSNGKRKAAQQGPLPARQEEEPGFLEQRVEAKPLQNIKAPPAEPIEGGPKACLPELEAAIRPLPEVESVLHEMGLQPVSATLPPRNAGESAPELSSKALVPRGYFNVAPAGLAGGEPAQAELTLGPTAPSAPCRIPVEPFLEAKPAVAPEECVPEPAWDVMGLESFTEAKAAQAGPEYPANPPADAHADAPAIVLEDPPSSRKPQPALEPVDPDAPAPRCEKLMALPAPQPCMRSFAMRRVRVREMFFPLPRLSNLPLMAAQMAQTTDISLLAAGPSGLLWHPGAFSLPDHEARTWEGDAHKQASREIPPELSRLEVLPSFSASISVAGLREARQAPMELPAPPGEARVAQVVCDGQSRAELQPATPHSEICNVTGLSSAPVLELTVVPCPSGGPLCTRQPEPCPQAGSRCLALPRVRWPQSLPSQLRPADAPLPLPVSPLRGPGGFEDLLEPRPIALAESPREAVLAPSVHLEPACPPMAQWPFPLMPGAPVALAESRPAQQQLKALAPDQPVRALPVLRLTVVEDSAVHEAVRAVNEVFQKSRSWAPRLHMPLPSFSWRRPDAKWLMMSAPAILLLAAYSLTQQGAAAPGADPNGFLATRMAVLKQNILNRAAVALSDDFRSGLGEWQGKGDWSKYWSYDPAGFVRTGPLALYQPSLALTNYHMEFLGQIEKRAMGWVVRARDTENYYALKLILGRTGPLPSVTIERYAVINGKEQPRTRTRLPLQVQDDTLYRVGVDVKDSHYTLTVQGHVVDYWRDDRLPSGGVGFFSGKGEQARLRWVEVSHQYDFLGRLCAFLAPYSVPEREGSLRQ